MVGGFTREQQTHPTHFIRVSCVKSATADVLHITLATQRGGSLWLVTNDGKIHTGTRKSYCVKAREDILVRVCDLGKFHLVLRINGCGGILAHS